MNLFHMIHEHIASSPFSFPVLYSFVLLGAMQPRLFLNFSGLRKESWHFLGSSMGPTMPHLCGPAERTIGSDTTCWGDPRKEPTSTKVHGNKPKWVSILKPIGNRRSSPLDLYTMTLLFKLPMWDFFTHVWHSQHSVHHATKASLNKHPHISYA